MDAFNVVFPSRDERALMKSEFESVSRCLTQFVRVMTLRPDRSCVLCVLREKRTETARETTLPHASTVCLFCVHTLMWVCETTGRFERDKPRRAGFGPQGLGRGRDAGGVGDEGCYR